MANGGGGTSKLGYALLGLLAQTPLSGYGLRKLFATTPMANFSDSPGAVYPALERLARSGLIAGKVENSAKLRPRRVFHLTRPGEAELKAWLSRPLGRADVMNGLDESLLRFSFMDVILGRGTAAQFLGELQRELAAYIAELKQYHRQTASAMSLSGRLALESGIMSYESLLRWTKRGRAAYARAGRGERS